MSDPPRWHFRFDNFCSALNLLEEATVRMAQPDFTDLEKAGLVQRFEICWELGWKSMRDYLRDSGTAVDIPTAINVIRAGYKTHLIEDGDSWILAMQARNRMAHEYDIQAYEATADQVLSTYYPMLKALRKRLEQERASGN